MAPHLLAAKEEPTSLSEPRPTHKRLAMESAQKKPQKQEKKCATSEGAGTWNSLNLTDAQRQQQNTRRRQEEFNGKHRSHSKTAKAEQEVVASKFHSTKTDERDADQLREISAVIPEDNQVFLPKPQVNNNIVRLESRAAVQARAMGNVESQPADLLQSRSWSWIPDKRMPTAERERFRPIPGCKTRKNMSQLSVDWSFPPQPLLCKNEESDWPLPAGWMATGCEDEIICNENKTSGDAEGAFPSGVEWFRVFENSPSVYQ